MTRTTARTTARAVAGAILLTLAALALAACGGGEDGDGGEGPGGTLQDVIDRDLLRCGVKGSQVGFSYLEPDGHYSGFDIEFCRAIAAAVLDDYRKVEYVPTPSATRFELLSTGAIDVLIRTTTVTAGRDAGLDVDFAATTFYTGQSFAVRADSGIADTAGLDGATVCVQSGTTTEQNLDDFFNERGMGYTPLGGEDQENQEAFVAGRCDAWTADQSNLASRISVLDDPAQYRVLNEIISKEPLAPGVVDGDSEWKDVVNWVVYGMINAEELGVSQANVDAQAVAPGSTAIARLLGVPFEGGEVADLGFGVDPRFIQRAIRAVGNYGDVYERTVAQVGIARAGTLNALYSDGGILYAPPYR